MGKLRKDGQPKLSGGYRQEAIDENLKYKNLGRTLLIRIPESKISEVEQFLNLLDKSPERPVSLGENIFADCIYSSEQQKKIIAILQESMELPANRGGAIKLKIKEALALIEEN